MEIKLLTGMAGIGIDYPSGSIQDVEEKLAKRLIESGQAEPVKEVKRGKKSEVKE